MREQIFYARVALVLTGVVALGFFFPLAVWELGKLVAAVQQSVYGWWEIFRDPLTLIFISGVFFTGATVLVAWWTVDQIERVWSGCQGSTRAPLAEE